MVEVYCGVAVTTQGTEDEARWFLTKPFSRPVTVERAYPLSECSR
jgi:hypothetical protein